LDAKRIKNGAECLRPKVSRGANASLAAGGSAPGFGLDFHRKGHRYPAVDFEHKDLEMKSRIILATVLILLAAPAMAQSSSANQGESNYNGGSGQYENNKGAAAYYYGGGGGQSDSGSQ
jgi:hypothetical protein